MNSWQLMKQLQFLLRTRQWPDSPYGLVFSAVVPTQMLGDEAADELRCPFALLKLLDGRSDPQAPGIETERVEATVYVANAGDRFGEYSLLGGHRLSQGTSQGRGVLEVGEQLLHVVNSLNQNNQVRLQEVSAGAAEAAMVADMGYVCYRPYTLEAIVTKDRVYPQPNGGNVVFSASSTVMTTITYTLTWLTPYRRFDFHPAYTASSTAPGLAARGKMVLLRKAGAVASTSITDGTAISITGGDFGVSATDTRTTGSGSWTYSLFAQYDEYGEGTLRTSDPAYVTVTT